MIRFKRWMRAAAATGLLAMTGSVSAMSLSDVLQAALQHDPLVPFSLATYDADKEAGTQERAGLLPSVNARIGGAYGRTEAEFAFGSAPAEVYPSFTAGIEARQSLFRLDWFAKQDRADARDRLAEAGLQERKQRFLQRVADRYFQVLQAQDELKVAEIQTRAVEQALDNTRNRYEVDLVPGTDLREAQARFDLSQTRVVGARHALENAQEALQEIIGRTSPVLPELAEETEFPPLMPIEADAWVKAAQGNSPALAQAVEQLRVAQSLVRTQQSAALPVLDLVGSVSHADSTQYALGQKQDDARIGVELSIPIFAGGALRSRINEAQARERAAKADRDRIQLEIQRQVRQLYRTVQAGYAEVKAYRQALSSARIAETATRNGYEAGTRTITDVLDAKSRVTQALRDVQRTRYQQLSNLLQLKQAAGTLSERDFDTIDQLLAKAPVLNP